METILLYRFHMTLLKFFHVFFIFLWIGSLLSVSGIMAYQKEASEELARSLKRIYMRVEFPSMLVAVACGVLLLFLKDVNWKGGWLHMKLTFTVLLIICDLIVGGQVIGLQKKGQSAGRVGHFVLHYLCLLFLIGVLSAIYIIK